MPRTAIPTLVAVALLVAALLVLLPATLLLVLLGSPALLRVGLGRSPLLLVGSAPAFLDLLAADRVVRRGALLPVAAALAAPVLALALVRGVLLARWPAWWLLLAGFLLAGLTGLLLARLPAWWLLLAGLTRLLLGRSLLILILVLVR